MTAAPSPSIRSRQTHPNSVFTEVNRQSSSRHQIQFPRHKSGRPWPIIYRARSHNKLALLKNDARASEQRCVPATRLLAQWSTDEVCLPCRSPKFKWVGTSHDKEMNSSKKKFGSTLGVQSATGAAAKPFYGWLWNLSGLWKCFQDGQFVGSLNGGLLKLFKSRSCSRRSWKRFAIFSKHCISSTHGSMQCVVGRPA